MSARFTMAQKFYMAFGALFVLFSLFGLHSYKSSAVLYQSARDIESWGSSNHLLGELEANLENYDSYVSLLKEIDRENEYKAIVANIKKLDGYIDESFEEYREVLENTVYTDEDIAQGIDKEEMEALEKEVKMWEDYKAAAGKVVNFGPEALTNREAFEAAVKEKNASYAVLIKAINDDVDLCHAGEKEAVEQAKDIHSFVVTSTVGALAFVLCFILSVLYLMIRNVRRASSTVIAVAEKVAQGDLRERAVVYGKDEFGQIAVHFNDMMDNVRNMCGTIQEIAEDVSHASDELTANANEVAKSTEHVSRAMVSVAESAEKQVSELDVTDQKVTIMVDVMTKVTEGLSTTATAVDEAVAKTNEGNTLAIETINGIKLLTETVVASAERVAKLGEHSEEIDKIVEVITSIAGQTNLLALNAAIEAARAGEHGRGFAVVAEEIRKLAEESNDAALQIGQLIQGIQEETKNAVTVMNEGAAAAENGRNNLERTGKALSIILEMVSKLNASYDEMKNNVSNLGAPIEDIVMAMTETYAAATMISEEIEKVSASSQEQTAIAQTIASSSELLSTDADKLRAATMKFKL